MTDRLRNSGQPTKEIRRAPKEKDARGETRTSYSDVERTFVAWHRAAVGVDDAGLAAQVDDFAALGDPLAVHDVELDLAERRGDLVLDHLHADVVADDLVGLLHRAGAADIQAHRGVELQSVAAGRRLRRAVH